MSDYGKWNMFAVLLMIIGSFSLVAKGENDEFVNFSDGKLISDSITIVGHFGNITEGMPRTAVINECDPSIKSVREICELDNNGTFCKKIPFSYPHTFTINYNKWNFINAFAAPGDSIYMEIDVSSSPITVLFSGDQAELNQQYNVAFQYTCGLLNSVNLPSDTVAFEEYMPVFKKYVSQGRDSIDSYARKHNLSGEVISMLYSDNLYILANSALGYRGRNIEEMRTFFLDPIFNIFNEENTKVMIFPYHLSAIMNHFPDVRDKAPRGTVRDIMYACDEKAPVPDRSMFFNSNYYDRLYAYSEPTNEISIAGINSGSIIVYADGEIKDIADESPVKWLINEYKGHPIYLDISATWCGPCLAELKRSESLREHFKDSDIKFAVIWLRSAREGWIKLAPTISNTIQIFIDDAEITDRLMVHLNVHGFPTHLMIDKNGSITKEGVPSYLSPELPNFLNNNK